MNEILPTIYWQCAQCLELPVIVSNKFLLQIIREEENIMPKTDKWYISLN